MKVLEWLNTNTVVVIALSIALIMSLFIDTSIAEKIAMGMLGYIGGSVISKEKSIEK